jgi:benzoyl-CoA reductase/2-hydroxyglutaryl-CoA dehydratase subunit BcrC/BadD/HgdB
MDMSVSMGRRQDHSRAAFCDLMQLVIDEDINDETLKKRYDRFCKNRSKFYNPYKLSDGKPMPMFVLEHSKNGF